MPQPMPNSAISPSPEQEKPIKKPWQRQEGESVLWYNRYCRYQDLGPKRSLLAAVEQERTQITALKSTKDTSSHPVVLQIMADSLLADYNKTKNLTHEQGLQYMARVQSIFRDIREEMKVFDEALQRAALSHQLTKVYTEDYEALLNRREEQRQKATKGSTK
jgi:hypothetical protein